MNYTKNLAADNGSLNVYPSTFIPDGTNIIGTSPLFVDNALYKIPANSPAINMGDPAFGNHPISGNTYDIGYHEYHEFFGETTVATVSNVGLRNLTYTWSIIEAPGTIPSPSDTTGKVPLNGILRTFFFIKELGTYKLKLTITENGQEVTSKIKTLNVTN